MHFWVARQEEYDIYEVWARSPEIEDILHQTIPIKFLQIFIVSTDDIHQIV